jgi:hypothetical protein
MYDTAEIYLAPHRDDPAIKYKMVCLWVAISANYIIVLFPHLAKIIGGIIAGILDVELESRELDNKKNGLSSKEEGHTGGSSNNPPS